MKIKTYVQKRKWLNPVGHYNTGAIAYAVKLDYGVMGEVSIWDCGKKISLDFNVYSEKDAKQVAEKIDILIESMQEMKSALGKAYQDHLDKEDSEDYLVLEDC